MSIRIGVDTGGTFTDIVARNADTGEVSLLKTPSTPDDPGQAILAGLQEGERRGLWQLDRVAIIVHGTTVATNTLLQRRGARTALVTTCGFRDVLAIQRQNRPELYNLRSRRPEPLIRRQWRLEVTERILFDGTVETPIDEAELADIADRLRELDPQAVVVGLLNSHANPSHELQIGEFLSKELPGITLCLSHQIACESGEFERFSTAAANGYVQPIVEGYLERLNAGLKSIGVSAPLTVMKSSGGAAASATVAKRCIETALSGPAGGVRACVELANLAPKGNVIAGDMGGTSFDVAVVTSGQPELAREAAVGGLALRIPMLDIHTIGAGGGSIAWIDAGGALRVGPQSAGAAPGPACYGRGGDLPTVTDANIALGRLAPSAAMGQSLTLDKEAAERAIQSKIAEPLGMSVAAAALGMLRVANAAMVAALRKLTVERGIDPREYAYCPYGGAGPLHAAELAEELGAARVIIPAAPGVFSAHGLLLSDLREDRFASFQELLAADLGSKIDGVAASLVDQASDELRHAGAGSEVRIIRQAVALRYQGQSSSLEVKWASDSEADPDQLRTQFHSAHRLRYGFERTQHPVELVGVAISVELPLNQRTAADRKAAATTDADAKKRDDVSADSRLIYFAEQPVEAIVVQRAELPPHHRLSGPAVIEQTDTTTLVPPDWVAYAGDAGELTLERAT